jgi:hypothetical protein
VVCIRGQYRSTTAIAWQSIEELNPHGKPRLCSQSSSRAEMQPGWSGGRGRYHQR